MSIRSRWSLVAALVLAVALATFGAAPAARAQEDTPSLAILIVGDEENAELLRQEKALIEEIRRTRVKHERAQKLQLFSYHFNKQRERAYCEKRLNILQEDLVFVGIVQLEQKVPRKVVYRLDRIVRPSRAATDVLARAEELLTPTVAMRHSPEGTPEDEAPTEESPTAEETPTADGSPAASPAPAETPAGEKPPVGDAATAATRWCIQAGSFSQLANAEEKVGELKARGYTGRIERLNKDGATMFRVQVGSYPTRQDALEALEKVQADGFQEAYIAPLDG